MSITAYKPCPFCRVVETPGGEVCDDCHAGYRLGQWGMRGKRPVIVPTLVPAPAQVGTRLPNFNVTALGNLLSAVADCADYPVN